MITFDYDSYGPYARASYCADYMELLAMLGGPVHWGDYDDFLQSSGAPISELILLSDPSAEIEESGRDTARLRGIELVKSVVSERADVLGDRYPFDVRDSGLYPKIGLEYSAYAGILALCQLHAVGDARLNPELAFEKSVHASLVSCGLVAAHVGTGAGAGSFNASLSAAANALGFAANPYGVAHSRAAKDDGIDHVAKLNFNDNRSGQWVLIGQATCARSSDWRRKACEPSRSAWSRYMSIIPPPQRFLAVPHHVDEAPRAYLNDHVDEGFVIDRLRLCAMRSNQTGEERAAVGRLREIGVEPIH